MISFLLAILLGCIAGIFTGLIPGIHINLLSLILLSLSTYFLGITTPLILCVFIISMAITHTFLDTIPSIYLGAPDADTALSVLPGHKLLLKGLGHEAVKLTIIGSLLCLIVTIILMPLMIKAAPAVYNFLSPYIGYILLIVSVMMILTENTKNKKFWALIIFMASGVLGLITLTIPNLNQPLFPLLSGLFGISILLTSLIQKSELPKQYTTDMIKVNNKTKAKAISAGVFSGSLTGLFPGLGSAQAAIIAIQFVRNIGINGFLILIGGINTTNFLFSLVTLFTLQKARNGAIIAVMNIIESITITHFIIFISAALIAGGLATFLALIISKSFANFITKINYRALCISIIMLIILITFYFSSFTGLIILSTGTAIGLIPNLFGIRRSHAMGCLLLPVILFFIL